MDVQKDYYAELNLNPSATPQEVRQAYRALALQFHPDTSTELDAEAKFKRIQEAYEVLSDAEQRAAYDQRRTKEGLSQQPALVVKPTLSHQVLSRLYEEQIVYLLLEIYPRVDLEIKRLPLNLSLAIDRSTSMQGVRLQRVKDATNFIIDFLDDADVFSLVTFSDRAEIVLPGQSGINKAYAKSRASTVRSSGGTEILQGMLVALGEIDRWRSSDMVNHLILLTDGQTYGDEDQCIEEAKAAGLRKVGISTMGIGQDWNDKLLDEIAHQSGGTSMYIDSASKVTTFFRDCIHNLSAVVARDLTLSMHLSPNVRLDEAFRVLPYLERLKPDGETINLGQLGTDQPCILLLSLLVDANDLGRLQLMQLDVTADIPSLRRMQDKSRTNIEIDVSDQSGLKQQPPASIVGVLSKLAIFKMQEKTMNELEQGHVDRASQRLETMATRLLNLGENELAKAALLEAGRLARTGHLSPEGRKRIRYGTRSLSTLPKEVGYD
ncbi:MAG: DnaJ domain-containing protein [Anaerolineae bacterium]|nr:DnaJ domain-containing protein [Anaerolineae bacterium]